MIPKKATSIEFSDLRMAAAKIPKFASYFRGIKPVNLNVPSNILLFCRLTKSRLAGRESERFHHNRFVLVVNLQTNGCINVDGVVVPLSKGEAFLIFPFQFHSFLNLESDQLCWLIITFELATPEYVYALRNTPLSFSQEFCSAIQRLVTQTLKSEFSFESPDNYFALSCGLVLEELLRIRKSTILKKSILKATKSEDVQFLEKINHLVWQDIHKPKSVSEIARMMRYSESHLRSLFRKRMGTSLGDYLRRIYILQAASMIHQTEFNISQIAEKCGFNSVYSFSRSFKNLIGESPMAYRKKTVQTGPNRNTPQ